jgi:hypothetical protein
MGDVILHGAMADEERGGNLAIGMPGNEQAQHVVFAAGQVVDERLRAKTSGVGASWMWYGNFQRQRNRVFKAQLVAVRS